MRRHRHALSARDRIQMAGQLKAHFDETFTVDDFPMALYQGFDGELDTGPIIAECWKRSLPVYLPVLRGKEEAMVFAEYLPDTPLIRNRYGIGEPDTHNTVTAEELKTICLPLTAFDDKGGRLGMGGGYYDRTLAECRVKPQLVGLAFGFQQLDNCPVDKHDQNLDKIITPERVFQAS